MLMLQYIIPRELSFAEAQSIGGQVRHEHTVVDDPKEDLQRLYTGFYRLALWEEGGGRTNTGSSRIISCATGEPLTPAFIRRGGHRACQKHALFTEEGMAVVVDVCREGGEVTVLIERHTLQNTPPQDDIEILWKGIGSVREDLSLLEEWMDECVPEDIYVSFENAIRAGVEKAFCYHCRKPHFAVAADRDLCSR